MTKFEEWKERFGMKLKHEKWYDKGKEISGVPADNPLMMVGTAVFEFLHGGRSLGSCVRRGVRRSAFGGTSSVSSSFSCSRAPLRYLCE